MSTSARSHPSAADRKSGRATVAVAFSMADAISPRTHLSDQRDQRLFDAFGGDVQIVQFGRPRTVAG